MGLQSLPIPDLKVLLGYSKAVHEMSQTFLTSLPSEMLDEGNAPTRSKNSVDTGFGICRSPFVSVGG